MKELPRAIGKDGRVEMVKRRDRDDGIDGMRGPLPSVKITQDEFDVGQVVALSPCPLDHSGREIDPDDIPGTRGQPAAKASLAASDLQNALQSAGELPEYPIVVMTVVVPALFRQVGNQIEIVPDAVG